MVDVDKTIRQIRSVVGAKNDAGLARRLGLYQSPVSSWRARKRVPGRFVKRLNAPAPHPTAAPPEDIWPELQDRATAIALARFVVLRKEIAYS